MKNILFVLVILLLSFNAGFTQNQSDKHITGHVVDQTSGAYIPFINISIKGTTIGTAADATGHYFLKNLSMGQFTIVASGVGYKTVEKRVDLTSYQSVEVNFEMEEDQMMLEGVVVSSNRNETNRREAPSIVNVISSKIFENTNSVCLAQVLNFQPGLRVESNCQNCGFQQVRINGLDGPYSQVLIDSRPVFSALASVYGIEQIPANMIERVEVVRGGGSAIFGSNAIAGIVNIITKEPTTNSATVSNTSTYIGGKALDVNTALNASVVSDDRKTGVILFATTRQRSPFDANGDGFSEITKLNAMNMGFRGFYKTSDYSKLTFEYHHLYENRRGGNKFDFPVHEADIAEQAEHLVHNVGLNYNLFSRNNQHHLNIYSSAQTIDRNNYAGAQQDLKAYGKTDGKTLVAGAQYTYSMDTLLFMPAELTAGAEYQVDQLHDQILGYHRNMEQTVSTQSAFIQNEWKNRAFSLLIGGRFDKHNLIENPILSPRLNLRYNPNDWISFRTSYSSGFRAPQIYDEDLHGSAIGGEIAFIQNMPNLKTEKSQSYSGSIDLDYRFGKVQTELLIEGFYTHLNNVFLLEEIGADTDGNLILERRNGSGAVVQGVNIEAKMIPSKTLQLQFGMTFQKSEYTEVQTWSDSPNLAPQKQMFRSPNRYGYLTAYYEVIPNVNLSLSGTYTGQMLVQHFAGYVAADSQIQTPDFYDMNFKLSYDFKLNGSATWQLNGGIQNIFNSYQKDFDLGEFRDAGYIYGPSLPRSVFVGLKWIL